MGDRVSLYYNTTDVTISLSGSFFTFQSFEGADEIIGVEIFQFLDQTLDVAGLLDLMRGPVAGTRIVGTPDADALGSDAGADTIEGLDGNDRIL